MNWQRCVKCGLFFQHCPACPECKPQSCRWYYASGKQKIGPVSLSDLHLLLASGLIQPATMLLQEGSQRWVAAEVVSELSFPHQGQESSPVSVPTRHGNGVPRRVLAIGILGLLIILMAAIGFGIWNGHPEDAKALPIQDSSAAKAVSAEADLPKKGLFAENAAKKAEEKKAVQEKADLQRGMESFRKGDWDGALTHFSRTQPIPYYWRGQCYFMKREYANAISDLNEAAKTSPAEAGVYLWRGKAHGACGQYSESVTDLTEFMRLNSKGVTEAHDWRGLAHFRLGQYDKATLDCLMAIEIDKTAVTKNLEQSFAGKPNDYAFFQRGILHARNGDKDKAIADLAEAAKQNATLNAAILQAAKQQQAAAAKMPQPEGDKTLPGRALQVTVKTVGSDKMVGWLRGYNKCVRSIQASAADGGVALVFDFDTGEFARVCPQGLPPYPLLIRVFDKHGNYLTHFVTNEGFTLSETVAGQYNGAYQRLKAGLRNTGTPEQLGNFPALLLRSQNNQLLYPVNARDLRDAALLEVGFYER